MSSSEVTRKSTKGQEVTSKQPQYAREEKEQSASASASAGLNLNLFGAISGAFSGKSKKEKQADGSEVEHRQDNSAIKGVAMGNGSAAGAANAETHGREMRERILAGDK
ncbi:hypothetical protein AUEXF2481DRAFT_6227 [Aureobasidium subglaciale EXF-2481]|uniref:Uncharacterized protein n=1 Tax=Aureobasidium subglaciale (strain EXF-2481) TaxID=1043005 RepID=A0A074YDR7_AURSE|nr:uncharacterized protein AUEXF2481DRAFT_6227 [Aureobasidium subglaciale EXF-2481]KAI5208313.1 hypothetical protein E4T38_02844 [Aureobasidium subglaciale]KAI5227223.1 hypothetical protein E4T40_02717 [Aureobasidium subglaciale]KAI5230512.1 hypothetical protein E4T41_02843 [Aureobasidium subglaciale]KAI5264961.1 hypothetical protein E4T46_02621 [Aureobasidium subglaciale]KEQ94174.1 hypothetical protein AUEXF2481DRAFT_6227 [Aureobasidium subglaciale EXF-2481]